MFTSMLTDLYLWANLSHTTWQQLSCTKKNLEDTKNGNVAIKINEKRSNSLQTNCKRNASD